MILLDLFAFHVSREFIKIEEFPLQLPLPLFQLLYCSVLRGMVSLMVPLARPMPDPVSVAPVSVGVKSAVGSNAVEIAAGPKAMASKSVSRPPAHAQPEAATIRVAISKVDQLINLVGELVITQAMLGAE